MKSTALHWLSLQLTCLCVQLNSSLLCRAVRGTQIAGRRANKLPFQNHLRTVEADINLSVPEARADLSWAGVKVLYLRTVNCKRRSSAALVALGPSCLYLLEAESGLRNAVHSLRVNERLAFNHLARSVSPASRRPVARHRNSTGKYVYLPLIRSKCLAPVFQIVILNIKS